MGYEEEEVDERELTCLGNEEGGETEANDSLYIYTRSRRNRIWVAAIDGDKKKTEDEERDKFEAEEN